jgi:PAS domain S-box-containing protein
MTTDELFTALRALKDDEAQNFIKQLQLHQLELEIQNRELRQTQEQLAQSRLRYADLYDFSPIGYASLSADGVIEEINVTGGQLLGGNPHKLIGRLFESFVQAEDVPSFRDYLKRCRRSQKKRTIELRLVADKQQPIDIQLFTMATQDANCRSLQFRTAIIDVTTRKRAEADVRATQKHLEHVVAERTAELTSARREREEASDFFMKPVRFWRCLSISRSRYGLWRAPVFHTWRMRVYRRRDQPGILAAYLRSLPTGEQLRDPHAWWTRCWPVHRPLHRGTSWRRGSGRERRRGSRGDVYRGSAIFLIFPLNSVGYGLCRGRRTL